MNKQTKMWLGIALVGVAGYMLWKQSKKTTAALTGGVLGPKMKHFATAAEVVGGRVVPTSKQRFSIAQ